VGVGAHVDGARGSGAAAARFGREGEGGVGSTEGGRELEGRAEGAPLAAREEDG
jgi:hypothetical protein